MTDLETRFTERLDALMDKVPDELKPIAAKYGPVVLKWSKEDAWAWIELLSRDLIAAYHQLVKSLDGSSIIDEWGQRAEELASLNIRHSARQAVAEEAAAMIAQGVLRVLVVGLL